MSVKCWEMADDCESFCTLRKGHSGPHRFTPDYQIIEEARSAWHERMGNAFAGANKWPFRP